MPMPHRERDQRWRARKAHKSRRDVRSRKPYSKPFKRRLEAPGSNAGYPLVHFECVMSHDKKLLSVGLELQSITLPKCPQKQSQFFPKQRRLCYCMRAADQMLRLQPHPPGHLPERGRRREGRDGLDGFLLPGEKRCTCARERASVLPATAMPLLRWVGLAVA